MVVGEWLSGKPSFVTTHLLTPHCSLGLALTFVRNYVLSYFGICLNVLRYHHIQPVDGGGPGTPESGVEVGAGTQADPPLAVFQDSAGEIVFTVGVEIGDLDVDPGDDGAPRRAQDAGMHFSQENRSEQTLFDAKQLR